MTLLHNSESSTFIPGHSLHCESMQFSLESSQTIILNKSWYGNLTFLAININLTFLWVTQTHTEWVPLPPARTQFFGRESEFRKSNFDLWKTLLKLEVPISPSNWTRSAFFVVYIFHHFHHKQSNNLFVLASLCYYRLLHNFFYNINVLSSNFLLLTLLSNFGRIPYFSRSLFPCFIRYSLQLNSLRILEILQLFGNNSKFRIFLRMYLKLEIKF